MKEWNYDDGERHQRTTFQRLKDTQDALDAVMQALTHGRLIHRLEAEDPQQQVARAFLDRLDAAGFKVARK